MAPQREPARVPGHVPYVGAPRLLLYRGGFLLVQPAGLFRQDVLPGAKRRQRDRAQEMVRGGDQEGVERSSFQEGFDGRKGPGAGRQRRHCGRRLLVRVGAGDQAERGRPAQGRGQAVPLVAAASQPDASKSGIPPLYA